MTALERIKEIDYSNRSTGPIPNGTIVFLFKAFHVVREISISSTYHNSDREDGESKDQYQKEIDEAFEERMQAKE